MTSGSNAYLEPTVVKRDRRRTMLLASMYQYIHTKSIDPAHIKKSVQALFANLSQPCRPFLLVLKGPHLPLFAFS